MFHIKDFEELGLDIIKSFGKEKIVIFIQNTVFKLM
jgi:hypothetical protein